MSDNAFGFAAAGFGGGGGFGGAAFENSAEDAAFENSAAFGGVGGGGGLGGCEDDDAPLDAPLDALAAADFAFSANSFFLVLSALRKPSKSLLVNSMLYNFLSRTGLFFLSRVPSRLFIKSPRAFVSPCAIR